MDANDLLQSHGKAGYGTFPVCIDGYFFPKSPTKFFERRAGHVPLMVGWNSQEMVYQMILGADKPTTANLTKTLSRLCPADAAEVSNLYKASTDEEAEQAATELAGDRFIAFGTWRWSDVRAKTGGKPVYRYLYSRPRPAMRAEMGNATANLAGGVTRDSSKTPATKPRFRKELFIRRKLNMPSATCPQIGSTTGGRKILWFLEVLETYFANFIKTGNPNGLGVPRLAGSRTRQTRPGGDCRCAHEPNKRNTATGICSSKNK